MTLTLQRTGTDLWIPHEQLTQPGALSVMLPAGGVRWIS